MPQSAPPAAHTAAIPHASTCPHKSVTLGAIEQGARSKEQGARSRDSAVIEPRIEELFPENRIELWQAQDDFPGYEDFFEGDIEHPLEDEVYDMLEESGRCRPAEGDKLFGWPYWVQSQEYPFDRQTGTRMEFLFQVDYETNLPHMFGESGVAHLCISPDNPDELGFAWACC